MIVSGTAMLSLGLILALVKLLLEVAYAVAAVLAIAGLGLLIVGMVLGSNRTGGP